MRNKHETKCETKCDTKRETRCESECDTKCGTKCEVRLSETKRDPFPLPQSSYPTLVGFIGNDPICVVWAGFQNQEGEKENHRVRGGIRREELARNVRCHITPKRDGLCPAPFIVATPLARNGLEVHS